MIPAKKKTQEEIAALREGLGIYSEPTAPPPHSPAPVSPETQAEEPPPPPAADQESIVHLDLPKSTRTETKPTRSLRKHELPLAPAPASTQRTELPHKRHDSGDISQIRKREALAALQQPGTDPAVHLRNQTASPYLFTPGYLLAMAAGFTAYKSFLYITPAALIALASIIMVFIALRKPRSRHHAALLFIIVFLTLVFGTLHYAPLFQNAP